ncbi:MAG: hypothetical protein WCL00_05495 [Bacteroidota bacterium]
MKDYSGKILLFLLAFTAHLAVGQIIKNTDPKASFDRSKGILLLPGSLKGDFFLNDYLLTELEGRDTVFIINIKPGNYTAKVNMDRAVQKQEIEIQRGQVVEILPGKDSLNVHVPVLLFDDIREKVTGKYVSFIHHGLFNITQLGINSMPFGMSTNVDVRKWLTNFTTITGFQVTPGFSAGLGIAYNNIDLPAIYGENDWGYYTNQQDPQEMAVFKNVSFLPIFMDFRTHLSKSRGAPFIKCDVGFNLLLSHKSLSVYGDNNAGNKTYTLEMSGGGF